MKKLALWVNIFSSKRLSAFFFLGSLLLWSHQPKPINSQPLPPPPPLKVPNVPPSASSPQMTTPQPVEVPVSAPSASGNSTDTDTVREFTFQAPSNSPSSTPNLTPPPSPSTSVTPSISISGKTSFYRVEVSAENEEILEKVRAIEPFAYWEREQQIVYAGRFHQKDQAQQRVQELSQQGLSAQIVPVNRENEPSNGVRPR